jgi:hypothetical protein
MCEYIPKWQLNNYSVTRLESYISKIEQENSPQDNRKGKKFRSSFRFSNPVSKFIFSANNCFFSVQFLHSNRPKSVLSTPKSEILMLKLVWQIWKRIFLRSNATADKATILILWASTTTLCLNQIYSNKHIFI